jgi:exopolysaccharide production protein ExoZ
MLKEKSKLELVQVLRGVASLLVVLYHTTVNMSDIFKKDFLGNFFFFGNAGVDIFFVLSGFIITYTSIKSLGSGKKIFPFLRRRFVRIFPAYWIIIGFFLLVQVLFPSFYKTHYDFSTGNFLSTLFLLPGHSMVNGVSWTLSYELFFYALFSLAFLFSNKKLAFALGMLYALSLIAIRVLGYNFENAGPWVNLVTHPMNVEFFMGVLAAVTVPRISQRLSLPLIILGSLLFLAGGILIDNNYLLVRDTFNRVLVFGIPSFLIVVGAVRFELSKNMVVHNIFLLLGEASYSLYLLHLPLVAACMKIVSRFNIQNIFILHGIFLLLIAAICYGSILFFKWIERPVINKLNSLYKNKTNSDPQTLRNR